MMSEPTTVNVGLIIPNTGDLVAAWGTSAVNPNMTAIDGLLGGLVTLSLSVATTIALTASSAVLTPSPGPFQQQNALIRLTGTLGGNAVLQFTRPGFYIVENNCTVGTFYVQLAPASGGGNSIGAPPGRKTHVFYDGTSLDFVDRPDVGTAYDLHGVSALPSWMTACTVLPYLIKDGTIYNTTSYPQLGALLGSSFGGNGVSTFGVPDERARARIAVDTNTNGGYTNRLTAAISGVIGTTMGAAGGDQNLSAHTHANVLTDPGHTHTTYVDTAGQSGLSVNTNAANHATPTVINTAVTGISLVIATTGAGVGANVQPSIVSFLPLIKT
jgi:microcystin-dependent protein